MDFKIPMTLLMVQKIKTSSLFHPKNLNGGHLSSVSFLIPLILFFFMSPVCWAQDSLPLNRWQQLFQNYGHVQASTSSHIHKVTLLEFSPEGYLQFLAETLRQRQIHNLQSLEKLLETESKSDLSSQSLQKKWLSSLTQLTSQYRQRLAALQWLNYRLLQGRWAYGDVKDWVPKSLRLNTKAKPYSALKVIYLSPEEQRGLIDDFLGFLKPKLFASGISWVQEIFLPKDLQNILRQANASIVLRKKLEGWLDLYHQQNLQSLHKLVRDEPTMAFITKDPWDKKEVFFALAQRIKLLRQQIHSPLDLSILRLLKPEFVTSLGNVARELPEFHTNLLQALALNEQKKANKKLWFTVGACGVSLLFQSWPLCALAGGWHLGKDWHDLIHEQGFEVQNYRAQGNEAILNLGPQNFLDHREAQKLKTVETLMVPLAAVKILPVSQSWLSSLPGSPLIAKGLRWPWVRKAASPAPALPKKRFLGCLLGSCKTGDKAFSRLLTTKSGETARSWYRPLLLTVTYSQVFGATLSEQVLRKSLDILYDHPEDPFFPMLAPYRDLLETQPQAASWVLSTLYRLEHQPRYHHLVEYAETQPLGLQEFRDLMEQTDEHLVSLVKNPLFRGSIQKVLNGNSPWETMNREAQEIQDSSALIVNALKKEWIHHDPFAIKLQRKFIAKTDSEAPTGPTSKTTEVWFFSKSQKPSQQALGAIYQEALRLLTQHPDIYKAYIRQPLSRNEQAQLQSTVAHALMFQSLLELLIFDIALTNRGNGTALSHQQLRPLIESSFEALVPAVKFIYGNSPSGELLTRALERLYQVLKFASEENPIELFYVDKNSQMKVDEIFPMDAAISLAQQLFYYQTLMTANELAPERAHPLFSPTGQKADGTVDELLAWSGRGYGHNSISSVLMASLHFEETYTKNELDTLYLQQKINHPLFQRLLDTYFNK